MEAFKLVGIYVRTINKDYQSRKDIGALWQRWFEENCSEKISSKLNEDIINLYTNYVSDEHDYYTTVLGHQVDHFNIVPEGMMAIEISKLNYEVFESKGILPHCVLDTWEHIWKSDLNRAYVADFDVYDNNSFHTDQAEVKTFVSIT